jgi:Mg/Co/Ni transporter MgtE
MRYVIVGPTTSVEKIKQANKEYSQTMFPVVTDHDLYLGYILMDDLGSHPGVQTAGEVLEKVRQAGHPRIACVHRGDSFDDALTALRATGLPLIPVIDYDSHFIGTLDSSSGGGQGRYYSRVG